jgi:FixJ family two-component response regulator
MKAYDHDAADFLLKPIENYARFLKAVRKAMGNLRKPASANAAGPNRSTRCS